jgi:pimeloyl-ACP methyl ester carboxylesterase
VPSDNHTCGEPCALECAETCVLGAAAGLVAIDLAEARARFQKETTRGVCQTAHYRMPYYIWGEGPPLVFVHGLADNSHSFLMPISRLSAHFRCIAYDLPSGRGDRARIRHWTHDDLIRDLRALLDHLRIEHAYLFGSSFGSTVVLTAMAQQPQRVPQAVLQGGLAHRPLTRRERWIARVGQYIPGTVAALRGRERVLRKINGEAFVGRPEEVWRYFIDCTAVTPLATVARQALVLNRVDMRPLLPQVRQPVLLVCGDRDTVVPGYFQDVLQDGLPNAGRATIQGCGHVPSYTHPEALAEVVRQFLTPSNGK